MYTQRDELLLLSIGGRVSRTVRDGPGRELALDHGVAVESRARRARRRRRVWPAELLRRPVRAPRPVVQRQRER
ncbi:MAG: hypothetical protein ABSH51_16675 [Solirubrobacteraceae bacterium]|jgi:hypothetical protein